MSFVNPLKAIWASGRPSYGGWLVNPDPLMAEFMASCGWDEICVDLQHSSVGGKDLATLFMAIAAKGVAPTARVPANDPVEIGNVLDLGAAGFIVPMVNTAEEAARIVSATRYPPRGTRSAGWVRSFSGSDEIADVENVAIVAMIETAAGLANVEAIAATPGLDALYIGPGDLALALGVPFDDRTPEQEKLHSDAILRIRRACERAGVVAGIHCGNGAEARAYAEQGFRMLTVTSDLYLVKVGGRRELEEARRERSS